MSEMVERVARALCSSAGYDPDKAFHPMPGCDMWVKFLPEARAAIAAMREPTEEMKRAMANAARIHALHDPQAQLGTQGCVGYLAGIDTALGDAPGGEGEK